MNVHKNARLTARGRERVVELRKRGQTPKAIADHRCLPANRPEMD